jgi:hypothetical protein
MSWPLVVVRTASVVRTDLDPSAGEIRHVNVVEGV